MTEDITFCTTKQCTRRARCLRAMDHLKNFSGRDKSYADFKCSHEKPEYLLRVNVLRE